MPITWEEEDVLRQRRSERQEREQKEVEALFTLAQIKVEKWFKLENRYWPDSPRYFEIATPWYLAKTEYGLIVIGRRKRVWNIDWSDTLIRKTVTHDEVTKTDTYVHAWTLEKALEYLKELVTPGPLKEKEVDNEVRTV